MNYKTKIFFTITGSRNVNDFLSSIAKEMDRLKITCKVPTDKRSGINCLVWVYALGYRVDVDEFKRFCEIPGFFHLMKVCLLAQRLITAKVGGGSSIPARFDVLIWFIQYPY